MAFAFCPYCGGRLEGGFRFCPYCGSQLNSAPAPQPEPPRYEPPRYEPPRYEPPRYEPHRPDPAPAPVNPEPAPVNPADRAAEREKNISRAKAYCIRGMWNDARAIYERMIFDDPMDMDGYMGLVRVSSQNYTSYDDPQIEDNIRVAKKICGKEDLSEYDPDYKAYSSKECAGDFDIKDGVLMKYNGTRSDVVVPEGIRAIADDAFAYKKTLRSVSLPSTLTEIGRRAFNQCTELTSVRLPDGLKKIGECAFYHCALRGLVLPLALEEIGYEAFACGCRDDEIVIPSGIRTMGGRVFENTIYTSSSADRAEIKALLCKADSKPAGWKDSWHYAGTTDGNSAYHSVSWSYRG